MKMDGMKRAGRGWWLSLLIGLTLIGCARPAPSEPEADGSEEPPFIESGDLAEIHERGTLRILVPRLSRSDHLPREGRSAGLEKELAAAYAYEHGLEPYFVYVDSRAKLIPSLLEGLKSDNRVWQRQTALALGRLGEFLESGEE